MPYNTVLENQIEGFGQQWNGFGQKMLGRICYLINGNRP